MWDKAAEVKFIRPGTGTISACFELTAEQIAQVKVEADQKPKFEPCFEVMVLDEAKNPVALVKKRLHVRRRER